MADTNSSQLSTDSKHLESAKTTSDLVIQVEQPQVSSSKSNVETSTKKEANGAAESIPRTSSTGKTKTDRKKDDRRTSKGASDHRSSSVGSSKLEDLLAAMNLNNNLNEEEHLLSVLGEYLSPAQVGVDDDDEKDSDRPTAETIRRLKSLTVDGVIEYLKSEQCQNVIVMVGAGISTSAGIPDFRSPNSGIYSKLARYNLPSPECVFEINYFKQNPKPFFELAKELFDYDRCRPTPCHAFIRLLQQKNRLLRLYTQNIDGLEFEAGLPDSSVVTAHGSFHKARCLACKKEYDFEHIRRHLFDRADTSEDDHASSTTAVTIPRCTVCENRPNNIIKPDIVFFGEQLPAAFYDMQTVDFPKCDLLLIIGTSLSVQPFAALVDAVGPHVPRVLINREKCGTSSRLHHLMGIKSGLEFNLKDNYRDVFLKGDCDSVCCDLIDRLGWSEEFQALLDTIRDPKSSR